MGWIGDFVGIDPDKARLDPGVEAGQIVAAQGRLRAKGLADQRREPGHKGGMTGHLHLEEQALALMDTHGARLSDWQRQSIQR